MILFYQADAVRTLAGRDDAVQLFGLNRKTQAVKLQDPGRVHLLATNNMGSPIATVDATTRHPLIQSVFGFMTPSAGQPVGFNGERHDIHTGMYALGQGYRWYSTILARFTSADSVSPFGAGGTNAYTYVHNDPVNHIDPDGHTTFGPMLHGEKMRRFHRSFEKIITFEGKFGVYKSEGSFFKKPKLLVFTHGKEGLIKIGDNAFSPTEFSAWLANNQIDLKKYRKVMFATCLGGLGFGQEFANLNKVKVKAIAGISDGVMLDDTLPGRHMFGLLSEPYKGMAEGTSTRPWAFEFKRFKPYNAEIRKQ